MDKRIKRLEAQLMHERKKSLRLERSLLRAHRNLEELRERLWGNKLVKNKAENEFKALREDILRREW